MQRRLISVRVVDSSDNAVRVSTTASPFFIGGNGEGNVLNAGRSEGGDDGKEGIHFWSRICDVERGVNGV